MKLQEIKEMAQRMEITAGKMKKSDLIRAIQKKEGNADCFESGVSSECGQHGCLWSGDCK
jgi:hypothetical protein